MDILPPVNTRAGGKGKSEQVGRRAPAGPRARGEVLPRSGAGGRARSETGRSRQASDKFSFNAGALSLAFVPFVMVLGNSILIPVLPAMKAAMRLSSATSGLIITAFSVPAGVLIPFAGFLADRYGRKAVMVPGLITYAIGGFIAAAAAIFLKSNAFWPLMVGRVVQGLGAAGTANIAMALAGDLYSGAARGQALGVLEAFNGFGKVASPILGAAIGLLAWYAPFIFFASLTVPVALAVAFLARDVKPAGQSSAGEYFGSVLKVFSKKGAALGAALAGGMVALYLLFGTLFYLSETLEKEMHLEGVVKGLVLAVPVLASSVSAYVSGTYLQRKIDRRYLVFGGLTLITLALASLAFIKNPYFLYATIFVVGVGSGTTLATVNVLVTSSVDRAHRGMITSDYGAVRFFGVAVGPPIFGLLMERGNAAVFGVSAGIGAVAAALALVFIDQKKLMATGRGGRG